MNAEFFSAEQLASFGMDVHAGVGETAGILAVRPDLVRPDYRTLPSQTGRSLEELRAIATAPGWQGYLSAPALATAQYGAAVEKWWIEGASELILDAIGGEDMSARPRAARTSCRRPSRRSSRTRSRTKRHSARSSTAGSRNVGGNARESSPALRRNIAS